MTDNEKKTDEDLQRAAEEFFAAKVSQGYTPEQATLMLHERFYQVRKAIINDRRKALRIVGDTPPDKRPA
jgi:hypothetical protein